VTERPITWVGTSLKDVRGFPADARRKAGHELFMVQIGLAPSDWKPMSSIGPGVMEIRVHTQVEHRVFYVAKFSEAVYVLHAFRKAGRSTPKPDLDQGRRRLQEVVRSRRRGGGGNREG
jgi:phage-related protein